jgi:hypothetical protein
MNLELAEVAERLVQEFPDLPILAVIGAVCQCADECDAGPFFIEQAVRARLSEEDERSPQPAVIPAQTRLGERPRLRLLTSLHRGPALGTI